MRTLTILTIGLCGLGLLQAGAAAALTPAEKCEASKLKEAGKYGFCRLKAESKAVKTASTPDYSKCDAKYGTKWPSIESGGGGMCPSNGDQATIQAFITQHTDDLAAALAGGPLPDCSGDLATCNGDLSTCTGSLGTCTSDLGTCNGNLANCNTNLTATTASLTTCTGNLSTCTSDLGTCTSDLGTCTTSLSSCSGSLATVNAGTAVAADVLSGKTFSSGAGIGLAGGMANIGQQNVTPGTAPVTISQGYHDGTGTIAGDPDLVAANIKSGVDIFGVTGTLSAGGLPKTGQTTTFGTGSDGDLEKGAARSFTDNGDGTITDNLTGLMWEKKSDDGSIHDKDNTYTWGLTSSPYTMNGTMVTTFLATLNGGGGFAGYTDWRIPNRFELESLVNLQNLSPATYSAFNTSCAAPCTVTTCSCTQSYLYWSSTTYQYAFSYAWYVAIDDGDANSTSKDNSLFVRAVRGGS